MQPIKLVQINALILISVFTLFLLCKTARAEENKSETMVVNKIEIKIIDAPGDQNLYRQMAQRLISLNPGQSLTSEKIKASLNALSLSNRFATIHVDTQSAPNGENVLFALKPYRFIEDIVIRGNYPLFEKEVLNQMSIYSGDVFRPEELSKQARSIEDRYRREGYVEPKVTVNAKDTAETGNVTINVDIKKGNRYLPGRLVFTGNRAIGVTWLKPRMKTWRTGLLLGAIRFTEPRLKADIARLKAYYRNKGYCDVEIGYELDKKSRFPKVDVKLNIHEGPRYQLEFEGNDFFWKRTLKKDVVIFKEGNHHGLGLRKSIKNIKARYLQAGFMETKVVTRAKSIPDDSGNRQEIFFVITEGPRTIVSDVVMNGNKAITDDKIQEQILTRPPGWFHSGAFQQETLNEDIFAIETLYLNDGYQDAKVDHETTFTEDRLRVSVAINIREGERTIVESVAVEGSDLISLKTVKSQLRVQPGAPFRSTFLKEDESYISRQISEKGYPHVVVKSKAKFNPNRTGAEVLYSINPGPRVHLGQIFVSGNLKTKEKIILRELNLKPETPLSLQKMADGQRSLRDLDIFRSVQFKAIGLKEKEDTVNLFVEVQESKPYYAQTSLGYRSDTKGTASMELGDTNFLGLNKSISGYAEVSSTGYKISSTISEPRLFGHRISANLSLYDKLEKEINIESETEEYGATLGFGRKWTDHLDSTLTFSLIQIRTIESPGEIELPIRTVFETVPGISYDNRDSFIKPTKGGVASFSINIPKGFEYPPDDFFKYTVRLSYYLTPIERITLAWQGRVGHIQPYGKNKDIPPDRLLSLGGTNNVRGFDENALRIDSEGNAMKGRTTVFGSLEIRFNIGSNWELATFFDTGSVQDAIPDADTNEAEGTDGFRSSAGLGLRYITPVGPIGLLYGHKLEVKEGESPGRWHFSIGYTF